MESEVDTEGQAVEEICQGLLEKIRIKIEYLKNINENNHVVKILHKVAVEKMNPKLKQYMSVSDLHHVLDDEL